MCPIVGDSVDPNAAGKIDLRIKPIVPAANVCVPPCAERAGTWPACSVYGLENVEPAKTGTSVVFRDTGELPRYASAWSLARFCEPMLEGEPTTLF